MTDDLTVAARAGFPSMSENDLNSCLLTPDTNVLLPGVGSTVWVVGFEGSYSRRRDFTSLNSRLKSNKEEEKKVWSVGFRGWGRVLGHPWYVRAAV